MPWILLLLFCLFSAPAQAVTIPGVTTGASTSQQTTPAPEPDVEQKKAAYSALADVLENDTSRQELIEQLRTVAATPPQDPVPKITPPDVVEQKPCWKTSPMWVVIMAMRYQHASLSSIAI